MSNTKITGKKKLTMDGWNKDGWSNLVTGLNSAATAKKKHTHHRFDALLSDQELESMYVEDGLAARAVRLLPDDMFREGWTYLFPKLDELAAVELSEQYSAVMEAVGAQQIIKEAYYWARLYGGALILIGALDGQTMDRPLDPKRIKSFEKLKVIDRLDVEYSKIQFQTDPLKPRYGMPEYYPIKFDISASLESEKMVHHSRIIELHGDTLPRHSAAALSAEQRYWGISVLQRASDRLKTLGSSLGSIDQLLEEMSVGKFKVKDLSMMLASPEGKAELQRRIEIMDMTRSVFRSQYFDLEENFERETANFTGVPEILYIIFMLIAADTGYPITRLFGVSPAGMNATGESDMRNYYDAVRAEQSFGLLPVLLRIARIISQWKNIEEPYIEFAPLETMNEKEKSELEKQRADKESVEANTYKTLIDAGVLEPYEARWLKFGDTLDGIPAPEDALPPVVPVPDAPPENEPADDDDDAEAAEE
jgi:phage-related protein (TIGR01555 family)